MAQVRIEWHGDKIKGAAREGGVKGLRMAAEHLLTESRKLVPIEEATLERSGTASVDEGQMKAAVAYDTPYAVRQHEELGYRHDKGRQAKYLEQPANAERDKMLAIIAQALKRDLGL